MAVAFPSSTQATSSDAGGGSSVSVNVNPPSGLTSGDIWLIVAVIDHDGGSTLQTPSGFTAAHSQVDGDPGYPGVRTFWKAAGSSESAVSVSSSGGQNFILWCASVRVTGADTTSPIGNAQTANPSGTGTTQDAPDVTIQNDGSGAFLVCAGSPMSSTPASWAAPSGATLLQSRDTPWPLAAVAYELRDAGSYAPGDWTITAATTNEGRIAVSIEIVPTGSGGASVGEGTLSAGDSTVAGTGERAVTGTGALLVQSSAVSGSGGLQLKLVLTQATSRNLVDESGAPVANLADIAYEWYDALDNTDGNPTQKGTFSTDENGEATIQLPNSALTSGQSGTLILYHPTDSAIRGVYRIPVT